MLRRHDFLRICAPFAFPAPRGYFSGMAEIGSSGNFL
jgi:hypothetical protein